MQESDVNGPHQCELKTTNCARESLHLRVLECEIKERPRISIALVGAPRMQRARVKYGAAALWKQTEHRGCGTQHVVLVFACTLHTKELQTKKCEACTYK